MSRSPGDLFLRLTQLNLNGFWILDVSPRESRVDPLKGLRERQIERLNLCLVLYALCAMLFIGQTGSRPLKKNRGAHFLGSVLYVIVFAMRFAPCVFICYAFAVQKTGGRGGVPFNQITPLTPIYQRGEKWNKKGMTREKGRNTR